jgi:hypothetical protein
MPLISVNWPQRVTSQLLGGPSISTINSSTNPSLSGSKARWKKHLEGIAFCPGRDRAKKGQTDSTVVRFRTHHQCGTLTRLLMPCLRIELEPDQIPSLRDIGCCHLPRLPANRSSAWDFSVQILRPDSLKEFSQDVPPRPNGTDPEAAVFNRQIDRGAFLDLRLGREGARNAQAKAVSPFLNLGLHTDISVCYKYLKKSRKSVCAMQCELGILLCL